MMWLLTNWRLVLTASSIFGLLLMTSAWQAATAQRDAARMELQSYKQAAEAAAMDAKIKSDNAIQEIRDAYHVQTLTIEQTAFRNAKARFGSCPAAHSPRTDGVQPGDSLRHSQAGSAEVPDGVRVEEQVAVGRDFIEACATDAGQIILWQQWVTTNQLPIAIDR